MQFDPDEYASAADDLVESVQKVDKEEALMEAETDEALAAAMQRMEEANLWKVLIKQDVFSGGSARKDILDSANKKLKRFALNELNRLLNIDQKDSKSDSKPESVFDKDEQVALKYLAAAILKRNLTEPTKVKNQERVPKVNTVVSSQDQELNVLSSEEPSVNKVASIPSSSNSAPRQRLNKRPGRTGGKTGYARPTTRPLPIPTAEQMIGTMQPPAPAISKTDISNRDLSKLTKPHDLVSAVVTQLTKGQVVSEDNSITPEEDINARF